MKSVHPAEPMRLEETRELSDIVDAIGQLNHRSMHLLTQLARPRLRDAFFSILFDMTRALHSFGLQLATNPQPLLIESLQFWQRRQALWHNAWLQSLGEEVEPVVEPDPSDRRFLDDEWTDNVLFNFIKQHYLLQARCMMELVQNLDDLNETTRQQLGFYVRQVVNALAPSNFIATNPEVLRVTLASHGRNLVRGLDQLIADLQRSEEGLAIAMTDYTAFEVGGNLACTPGSVVYQNDLMQLLQYTPSTETVFKTPLLIIPPWINKYYILDLSEKNSFIKWLVAQGHTVFTLSWVNPGPELSDKGFDDYLLQGPLAALDAIEQATGERQVNLLSYCIGGTLTAATLAYLAAKRQARRVKSATYMTTLLDFSDPGEIGVFLNETALRGLENEMKRLGYMDGRIMSLSFNLLRENDLFWSFFVNNYLKGETPPAFDLLYWNADNTNLPYAMHSFYLRQMYLQNRLVEPGGIELAGVPIDLRRIKTPAYFVSTLQDHIAKWTATYQGVHLHSGKVTFVLSGSGHIAGIINPPAANKYGYWTNDQLPETPEAWFETATEQRGSWWPHWQGWLQQHAYTGARVPARHPGDGKLAILEEAPGSYVKTQILDVIPDQ